MWTPDRGTWSHSTFTKLSALLQLGGPPVDDWVVQSRDTHVNKAVTPGSGSSSASGSEQDVDRPAASSGKKRGRTSALLSSVQSIKDELGAVTDALGGLQEARSKAGPLPAPSAAANAKALAAARKVHEAEIKELQLQLKAAELKAAEELHAVKTQAAKDLAAAQAQVAALTAERDAAIRDRDQIAEIRDQWKDLAQAGQAGKGSPNP